MNSAEDRYGGKFYKTNYLIVVLDGSFDWPKFMSYDLCYNGSFCLFGAALELYHMVHMEHVT